MQDVYVSVIFTLLTWAISFVFVHIVYLWFCPICGIRTSKYLVTTTSLKDIMVDYWTWYELLDLEVGNFPMLKDLANSPIHRDIFDSVFYLMQALSSPWFTCHFVSVFNCYIVILIVFDHCFCKCIKGIFHLIHWRTLKVVSYWSAFLDIMPIFIWCLGLHMVRSF